MNQSNLLTNPNKDEALAGDIWAMLGANPGISENTNNLIENQPEADDKKVAMIENIPDLATEILSKLNQKKEVAAAHLGISAAEVETMPFDLTALEQAGIFLNIDATGFSVLSRQLDWQSLGIELTTNKDGLFKSAAHRTSSR